MNLNGITTGTWLIIRRYIWQCMGEDNADHLMVLLNMLLTSNEERDCGDLLYALELQIWPPVHNREHNCGLVAIAAGIICGVPAAGALQCLRALIDWASVWHREYRFAINRARNCGSDHSNAIQLLLHHARVQYPRRHRRSKHKQTRLAKKSQQSIRQSSSAMPNIAINIGNVTYY